jgi:hypothetical protein
MSDRKVRTFSAGRSAAIDGRMANVLALDDINDILGDIGGVVADPFEVLGNEDEFESRKNNAGIAHHVGEKFTKNLVAILIDLIVIGQNFLSEVDIAADNSVEGIADLFLDDLAHAWQIDIGFDPGMAKDAQGTLGDVDGLIADAFEIIVDAGNGQDETEVCSHELMESEELHDTIVNFELQFIDGVFFIEHAFGELLVGIENGMNSLMNGAFGETAHPKQPLFELV